MKEFNIIILIRLLAAVLFLMMSAVNFKIFLKERSMFWLLVSLCIFMGFLDSVMNILEWANILPLISDVLGEYFIALFFVLWIYVSLNVKLLDK